MDKYEEIQKKMMSMPDEERMQMMKKLESMCICASCPSYVGTGETGLFFCSKGKSAIITEEKGCTCPGCPVTPEMGLKNLYFCTRGSEKEQRGM